MADETAEWWALRLSGLTARAQNLRECVRAAEKLADGHRREADGHREKLAACEAELQAEIDRLASRRQAVPVGPVTPAEVEVVDVAKKKPRGQKKPKAEKAAPEPAGYGVPGTWPPPAIDRHCTLCGVMHQSEWPQCGRCAGAVPVEAMPAGVRLWHRKDGTFVALVDGWGDGLEAAVSEALGFRVGAYSASDSGDSGGDWTCELARVEEVGGVCHRRPVRRRGDDADRTIGGGVNGGTDFPE